jgi:hypothetical protein
MSENTPEVDKTIAEAKSSFDMRARLNGSARRKASIKIFTDEVAGEELGYAKDVVEFNALGLTTGTKRERLGVLGLIDGDDGSDDKYSLHLDSEEKRLCKLLDESAITYNIAAVPPLVIDGVRRTSRKELGIKGSIVPDDDVENYNKVYLANLFMAVIPSFIDHATGETYTGLGRDGAASIKELLPASEYARLDAKIIEVQFKDAIDESVTAQADF